jgi:hypothetical protein
LRRAAPRRAAPRRAARVFVDAWQRCVARLSATDTRQISGDTSILEKKTKQIFFFLS